MVEFWFHEQDPDLSITTRILGVILQSISINLEMFITARFFIGFGVGIAHGSSPLLITELVHTQHRAVFTTIYNSVYIYPHSVLGA